MTTTFEDHQRTLRTPEQQAEKDTLDAFTALLERAIAALPVKVFPAHCAVGPHAYDPDVEVTLDGFEVIMFFRISDDEFTPKGATGCWHLYITNYEGSGDVVADAVEGITYIGPAISEGAAAVAWATAQVAAATKVAWTGLPASYTPSNF